MASEERETEIQETWDEQEEEIIRIAGSDYDSDNPSYIPPHGDTLLTAEEFYEIYGETNAELIDGRVVFPGVEFGIRKKVYWKQFRKIRHV